MSSSNGLTQQEVDELLADFEAMVGDEESFWDEMEHLRGSPPPLPKPECVCGAQKTYGKKTVLAHHALWCDIRKGK